MVPNYGVMHNHIEIRIDIYLGFDKLPGQQKEDWVLTSAGDQPRLGCTCPQAPHQGQGGPG